MTTQVLMMDNSLVSVGDWKGCGDSGETGGIRSVQVGLVGVGAISATIRISGANDGRFPFTVADFTLSGSNKVTDAVELTFPWEFYRAEVVAISGTGATATAVMKL